MVFISDSESQCNRMHFLLLFKRFQFQKIRVRAFAIGVDSIL